ncbi:MAG: phosphopantothenoylcysteine decarboxylase [Endomicrobiales bacterium]|jgi:phosphopantothenoylcysteine synthetase/decarboxylase
MNKQKLTFLITSGPTREYIDPVRYLSNASSGHMGCALALAAHRRGHRVIFITGPASHARPEGAVVVPVVTAREMFAQVKKWLPQADVVIGAAAVSDYRPRLTSTQKIKKTGTGRTLSLIENPDIIAYAGKHKRDAVVVGFALETADVVHRAQMKLRRKNLDLIIANTPRSLGTNVTNAWIIGPAAHIVQRKKVTKNILAREIIRETIRLRENG